MGYASLYYKWLSYPGLSLEEVPLPLFFLLRLFLLLLLMWGGGGVPTGFGVQGVPAAADVEELDGGAAGGHIVDLHRSQHRSPPVRLLRATLQFSTPPPPVRQLLLSS